MNTLSAVEKVYILWHVGPDFEEKADETDSKLLGVFSSEETARAWQERAGSLPGFRDTPERFMIETFELDQPQWSGGYETVMLPED